MSGTLGSWPHPTPAPVSIGVLVDNARERVMEQRRRGTDPDVILVSPAGHRALLDVKDAEQRRGAPLGLLGKRLRVDPELSADSISTAEIDVDAN